VIARLWRGWVATTDADAYVRYIDGTGMAAYRSTPGNLGASLLRRDLAYGRSEIVTLSFWASMDAVRAFAGPDPDRAVFYPDDDRYLVERETTVTHFDVPVDASEASLQPARPRHRSASSVSR
jgi:heme-degrading monooxygenase HmoA